jgi:hypothetical protein
MVPDIFLVIPGGNHGQKKKKKKKTLPQNGHFTFKISLSFAEEKFC